MYYNILYYNMPLAAGEEARLEGVLVEGAQPHLIMIIISSKLYIYIYIYMSAINK